MSDAARSRCIRGHARDAGPAVSPSDRTHGLQAQQHRFPLGKLFPKASSASIMRSQQTQPYHPAHQTLIRLQQTPLTSTIDLGGHFLLSLIRLAISLQQVF
ncbi:hypothetical protein BST61_g9972 [Cercospora zeina]